MEDDRQFFERRLKEELSRANTATNRELQNLHRTWAGLYRQRLTGLRRARLKAAA